jgi:hypothetical protein
MPIKIECRECGKKMFLPASRFKRTPKPFCSLECKGLWQGRNVIGFWKGKKIPYFRRPNRDVSGSKNPRWKGGERTDKDGYVLVLRKDHPYRDYHGYVRKHRLIIENKIKRYLKPEEVVHHMDGNKQNNNIENLKLYENGSEHQKEHYSNGDSTHLKNYTPS